AEMKFQGARRSLDRCQRGTGMRSLHAIVLTERAQRQPLPHFLFVYGMDVVGVAGIDRHGEARIGGVFHRESLGFAQLGPGVVGWRILAMLIKREPRDVEGKIALAEHLS